MNRMPPTLVIAGAAAWLLGAGLAFSSCGRGEEPPPGQAAGDGAQPSPGQGGNPLDEYVEKAGTYLASTQAEDGSWPYFHSQKPDFTDPEPHANLFGTEITLMNLTHTGVEASSHFQKGLDFVRSRMSEGYAWSFYEPGQFSEDSWYEADADTTSVALTLLAGRQPLKPAELKKVRALFDKHRTAQGLYLTYFDGFYGSRGFVPDRNVASIGINLNVLGFFGKHELPRATLLQALRVAIEGDKYWEKTTFYRSLPMLAYLASNAVESGAPEAGELMRRFLADFTKVVGADAEFASRLHNADLAAYVKARAHACLLDRNPCRDLDGSMFQLARRRKADGSWEAAPFYEYDVNQAALESFLERKQFAVRRKRGGFAYDVEKALASPGTTHYYDGSPAETTSFALKAIVFYRELLSRRDEFMLQTEPIPSPSATPAGK